MDNVVIAIDGPSGAGKSTLGKALAKRLGLQYIDSGAVYRAVGCKAIESGVSLDDANALAELTRNSQIMMEGEPDNPKIILDGTDITTRIRLPDASHAASVVATIPQVRQAVVEKLREMSIGRGITMDGRDIGTRVFPDATVKLFVDASHRTRTQRRWEEERERGRNVTVESISTELAERDRRDRGRTAAPLAPAKDAVVLDTSGMSLDDVIERALEIIQTRR